LKQFLINLNNHIKSLLSIKVLYNSCLILFLISLTFWHGKLIHFGFIGNKSVDLLNTIIYPSDILLVLLSIISLVYLVKNVDRALIYRNRFTLIILLILTIYFLAPRGTYNLYYEIRLIEYILCFITFYHVEYHIFAKSLYYLGIVESLIAIIQFHLKHSIGLHFFGEPLINAYTDGVAKIDMPNGLKVIRAYGTFNHPNSLSAFLLLAFAAGLFLVYKNSPKYFIGLFFIFLGLITTFSRAAYLSLFIFIVIATILLFVKKTVETKKIIVYTAIILVFFGCSLAVYGKYMSKRATIEDSSTYERIQYDEYGVSLFKNHWLVGSGIGNILYGVAKLVPKDSPDWVIQPPHNYFEIVSGETGIIGLIIFLLFLLKIFIDYAKALRDRGPTQKQLELTILFSTFISILLMMQFDHYFYDVPLMALLFWSFLGIISGAVSRRKINAIPLSK